jgi:hypothetical protein
MENFSTQIGKESESSIEREFGGGYPLGPEEQTMNV